MYYYENINNFNREKVNDFISSQWFSTDMVIRGKVVDMTSVDGIVCYDDKEIVGLITYDLNCYCEILSLDSLIENKGIGTELIEWVINIVCNNNINKIKVITTNDNIDAIKFYQKRGFDMIKIYHNAIEESRKLKPTNPLLGNYDIPIKHEIEFQKLI